MADDNFWDFPATTRAPNLGNIIRALQGGGRPQVAVSGGLIRPSAIQQQPQTQIQQFTPLESPLQMAQGISQQAKTIATPITGPAPRNSLRQSGGRGVNY
jgi:hypothetical protein